MEHGTVFLKEHSKNKKNSWKFVTVQWNTTYKEAGREDKIV
jgi:hypothetical protein